MNNLALFRNLLVMAAADHSLNHEEISYLSQRANDLGLSDQQFNEALAAAVSPDAAIEIPPEPSRRRELLEELLKMMAVDGHLAEIEKQLFAVVAAQMNISQADLDAIIDSVAGQ